MNWLQRLVKTIRGEPIEEPPLPVQLATPFTDETVEDIANQCFPVRVVAGSDLDATLVEGLIAKIRHAADDEKAGRPLGGAQELHPDYPRWTKDGWRTDRRVS